MGASARVSYTFIAKVLNGGAYTDTSRYRYRPRFDREYREGIGWVRVTDVFRLPLADLGTVKALDNWECVFHHEQKINYQEGKRND